ncbi:ACT domain-containing protein [Marinobacter zhejiangensis]|uniref:Acetolactate synthase, small subunit n=1 Tax=Marinobacter zhejiangensis TaxID=488535 RepID=A0A1I4NDY8_9GAMM|nr:ACT domain-containing protein [Marinobacter zhejiangensis]SFM13721.1 acetolactate synthase, small subunit [Marinobacter zhejiangensis]
MSQPDQHRIYCEMNPEPAAIERLCQVIRVRGFEVTGMNAELRDGTWEMALTLKGSRPVAMLQSQLEKLHTVNRVHRMPAVAAAQRA